MEFIPCGLISSDPLGSDQILQPFFFFWPFGMTGIHSEQSQPLWVSSVEGECEQNKKKIEKGGKMIEISGRINFRDLKCFFLSYIA